LERELRDDDHHRRRPVRDFRESRRESDASSLSLFGSQRTSERFRERVETTIIASLFGVSGLREIPERSRD
jgi:hypothetical protein